MNKTLSALMTKLQWQLNELTQQLLAIDQDMTLVDEKRQLNLNKLFEASATPKFILPEREIAGLHFIMAQQQQLDDLNNQLTTLQSLHNTLSSKKIRLSTELKMLEKHQANQLKIKAHTAQITEQKKADEWVLHRGGRVYES